MGWRNRLYRIFARNELRNLNFREFLVFEFGNSKLNFSIRRPDIFIPALSYIKKDSVIASTELKAITIRVKVSLSSSFAYVLVS